MGSRAFALRGKEIAFLILLAPIMIPYQAILTPLYLDFAKFGLVNTHLGLAIVHTILQLPFSIFLMRSQFRGDSARDRGGGDDRRLLGLAAADPYLPAARPCPVLVTVALFAFINSWNEFLAALIFMNRESSFTVPILLVSVRTRQSRRGRLGRAAGERHHFDHSLPCRLSRLAALLYFRPARGRRQMSDLRPTPRRPTKQPAQGARTIRDVARLAGVSIGTASKALNASGRLSAETRAKVLRSRGRSNTGRTISRKACIARVR